MIILNGYNYINLHGQILTFLTKKDDYSSVVSEKEDADLKFNLNTNTFDMLVNFSEDKFANNYKTDRLVLKKEKNTDFATIVYEIYLLDGSLIGYISLKCNGILDYIIFEDYKDDFLKEEAINKIVEVATSNGIVVYVRREEDKKERIRNLILEKEQ